ncbi:AAA family ATPase [Paucibacter sp. DJ1R-11]|uniref:AAA family ATPase n=1 Tax=Paucibacter sp. DJ1R-11 TaxID=2893556 RepID=UPI0021E4F74F|nr:AAA family ATPase [Paucibacter sp. DJ1R-11]MCV2365884.1 AAA family ATPase [Paucibacter sp. DJ1R-11]
MSAPLQLSRLRVEQLRQFRQGFELANLQPGLNIFCGPNEAGKSSLVRAIRAAFFERHRSSAVGDLLPWGDSSAAPSVELDFAFDGHQYRLAKSFGKRPRCDLRIDARGLEGAEAEDHLAQLFGYGFASRGASKTEHWGIPGLLWVEQGTGQDLREAAQHAREHLHGALQSQAERLGQGAAAQVAASGGDALLSELRAQRGELLTATGKPRAELEQAAQRVQALQQSLQDLDLQIARYREDVDRLAHLRSQHQRDEQERPWEQLQQQLLQAQQAQTALQQSEQQLGEARQRLSQLQNQQQLLQRQLQAFAEQERAATQREQALAQASEQLLRAQASLAPAREQFKHSSAQVRQAQVQLQHARQAEIARQTRQQLEAAQHQQARSIEALQHAEAAQQRVAALRAPQAQQRPLTKTDLDTLRKLDQRLRELSLQRQALATRLEFKLDAGQQLRLRQEGQTEAESLAGQGQVLLAAPGVLELPGLGRLRITPGGQDLDGLEARWSEARVEHAAAMERLGVHDLAEAESRYAAQQEALAQLKLAEQALALSAPQGLARLQQEQADLQARLLVLQDALAQQAAGEATTALSLAEAESALDAAQRLEDAARQQLGRLEQQHSAMEAQQQQAQRELELARAQLTEPGRLGRQREHQQQWLAGETELSALTARIEALQVSLDRARPDIVQQDIARLQRSVQQLQQAHQELAVQIQLIEQSLQQAGAQGLDEQREQSAGDLARAQRRWHELRLRAAALDLLCRKLDGKRQASLARLQAPLQQHLQRYVQLLFPDARLDVDEGLTPGLLQRGVESGDFEALSFGAREQLGLISRFAYADLLQEAGRPTLLILDDALVHSDAQRLAQMKRVIFDAAQRHQLLLFTCHPEDWRDLGVAQRSLR